MVVKSPCGVCYKTVTCNQKAIQCDSCNKWIHIRCNNVDKKFYNSLMTETGYWYCFNCLNNTLPYSSLTDKDFKVTINGANTSTHNFFYDTSSNLNNLFQNKLDNDNINCKYYDTTEYNKAISIDSKTYLHVNISSLTYYLDDLKLLLSLMNNKPNIIAISETRLNCNITLRTDIALNGYVFKHTDSHSNKGGTIVYIKSELNYNLRSDLIIQNNKELESTFIEILLPSEKNIIVGCIYCHPCMSTSEFNITYIQTLLDKLSLENKNIVLLGDFNINLLKYDSCNDVSNFLDLMCSFSLFPLITQPTRITPKSKTLIDNIFVNFHTPNTKSGNLTVCLADHLVQFISFPSKNLKQSHFKLYRRCFKNFDEKSFLKDLKETDWLSINHLNYCVNNSTSKFLDALKRLLDSHAPFKMSTKKANKSLSKPWITN
ncbi:uncharacterized protein LOC136081185 [Hydra vulgaris]|uniref:Uncharacterized protein LOC136081185 n=1 Tax=Hydra vulgaris TaxID=6087 RepID=A0ABM4BZ73_HYDVU